MSRSRLAIAIGAAVLLLAAVIVVPMLLGSDDESADTVGNRAGSGDSLPAPSAADESTGLDQVETFGLGEVVHTPDEVDYPQSPPAGGDHADAWLQCGSYDQAVREENMVHALGRHRLDHLRRLRLRGRGRGAVRRTAAQGRALAVRRPAGAVVVTVWDTQLALTGAGDPRLEEFIDRYGDGGTSPEPFASCEGGVEQFETQDS